MATPNHPGPDWHAACAQVAIDFAVAIDHGDVDAVLALFTEDGCLIRPDEVSSGQAELRRWLVDERPAQVIRHVCSNFSARQIAADRVEGKTYFTAYRAMGAPTRPVSDNVAILVGEWDDVFQNTAAGWRIKSRTVTLVFQIAG
ncbi:MAG: hypothetical protein GC182_01860 [Rhodopseudomonas sp.]|nr:hypothetical protein [Rhodopseudomonas sp.]